MLMLSALVLASGCERCGEGSTAARPGAATATLLSQAEFANALRAQLAQLRPGDQFVLNSHRTTLEWTRPGENRASVVAVSNLFDDYRAGMSVAGLAERTIAVTSIGEVQGNRVMVGLRERLAIETASRRLGEDRGRVPFKQVGSRLALALFDDRPEMMVLLKQRELEQLDAGFDQLWPGAVANVRQLPPLEAKRLSTGGIWALEGDDYGSTLALLGEATQHLSLKGAPVVAVLGRDSVLVTGADDAAGLDGLSAMLAGLLREMSGRDYFPTVVTLRNGEWVDFVPPADAGYDGEAYLSLRRQAQTSDLDNQQRALEETASDGGGPMVVSQKVIRAQQGKRAFRTALLLDTAETALLPEVDVLMLGSEQGDKPGVLGFVNWSQFRQVMGARCTDSGLWPTRYRVTGFPTAEQLKVLKPTHSADQAMAR